VKSLFKKKEMGGDYGEKRALKGLHLRKETRGDLTDRESESGKGDAKVSEHPSRKKQTHDIRDQKKLNRYLLCSKANAGIGLKKVGVLGDLTRYLRSSNNYNLDGVSKIGKKVCWWATGGCGES